MVDLKFLRQQRGVLKSQLTRLNSAESFTGFFSVIFKKKTRKKWLVVLTKDLASMNSKRREKVFGKPY
ncbi:hypothetical protein RN001_004480 [Aquatica leii]|uniref:Uncharacterized protein n=1 Tax=Aquatica leii TaxID=1421715 RepID=A0AAN7SA46_9COLE|nr:hypothetical protein RN001_004480 [Aquatica leii]